MIYSFIQSVFHYFPWVAGFGVFGVVVLTIVAPSLLTVAAAWLVSLAPLIKGAANAVVELGRVLYIGGSKILDDGAPAILFTVFAMILAILFFPRFDSPKVCTQPTSCQKVIDQLHRDYKFIPKTTKGVAPQPKSQPDDGWKPWWSRP